MQRLGYPILREKKQGGLSAQGESSKEAVLRVKQVFKQGGLSAQGESSKEVALSTGQENYH
jgi:hypothetical protein